MDRSWSYDLPQRWRRDTVGRTDFDRQAESYDQRAGLSDAVCVAIVQVVLELAEARPGNWVVEMGAGTGLIGRLLAQAVVGYVGIDLSRGMLTRFRQRLGSKRPAGLLQADGNCPWPLADGSARAVFSSRALPRFNCSPAIRCFAWQSPCFSRRPVWLAATTSRRLSWSGSRWGFTS